MKATGARRPGGGIAVHGRIAVGLLAAGCAVVQLEPMTALAQKPVARTAEYVQRMLGYSFEIRMGNYEKSKDAVAMMEAATAADPDNAELWAQLGNAYLLEATRLGQPGGKPMDSFRMLGKGLETHAKALSIDPDNVVALGGHGSTAAIFSLIQQKPEMGVKAVAEMNRAVELAPKDNAQRLLRVFTMLNMPANLRNAESEKADLDYLVRVADGTQQGDYIRVLYGDLHAEAGKAELARHEYVAAAKSSRPGGELAKERLKALEAGAVPVADILKLRQQTGAGCTMCHGS